MYNIYIYIDIQQTTCNPIVIKHVFYFPHLLHVQLLRRFISSWIMCCSTIEKQRLWVRWRQLFFLNSLVFVASLITKLYFLLKYVLVYEKRWSLRCRRYNCVLVCSNFLTYVFIHSLMYFSEILIVSNITVTEN